LTTTTPRTSCSAELFLAECAERISHPLTDSLSKYCDQPLTAAIRYATLNGGKRIRPALVYATALALDLDFARVDAIACAIELIHCYSLIHDDLPAMDDDDTRRGKPTCHKVFGEAEAILAGNAMQALAFEHLATAPQLRDADKLAAIGLLASAAGLSGMASGQAMDIKILDGAISLSYLEQTHRLKTGSLMASCVGIPLACAADCSKVMRRALTDFARDIGLCFQIQDDILDVDDGKTQASCEELNYAAVIGSAPARSLLAELSAHCLSHLEPIGAKAAVLKQVAHYITTRAD